jgi:pyruvate dehydrogenase E1 component beta subunit
MAEITYREAIRLGMEEALDKDKRVFLMGEDVGKYGGAYGISKGFLEKYGSDRIRDTPLSESVFVGAGIGAALGGLRPIVEVMTVNFCLLALDQIMNNAATLRHMSGGQFSVPLVIRMTTGGGRQLAAQHSHSLEGWLAHIPGIRVLAPATIPDARHMLTGALADPDPALVFEHALLFNLKGDLTEESRATASNLDRASVRKSGDRITLVTYGAMLWRSLEAAQELEAEGISVEVIDLRSLRPLDRPTIMQSVQKTHRLLVVDEAWKTGSISAEIIASVNETCFYDLDAPPARVCGVEVPMPYASHLEEAAMPGKAGIMEAARSLASS